MLEGPLVTGSGNTPRRGTFAGRYAAALWIAGIYAALGALWIAGSDLLLSHLIHTTGDPLQILTRFQTIKGWAFILVTGILLFLLVRQYGRSLARQQAQMQERLEAVALQYRMLFQQSPVAMLIFDPADHRILAANDVCGAVLGYSIEQLLQMRTLDLITEEDRQRARNLTAQPLPAVSRQGAWANRRGDGRIVYLDTISHPIEFDGRAARIVLLTDVTERLRAERALAEHQSQLENRVAERTAELSSANQQLRREVEERHRVEADLRAATAVAEAANAAKSTFLANTSHEIRTPLTSVLGYADLLADDHLSAADRGRYLELLQQNAQHLLSLIDDLLDLSRAEAGKVRLAFEDQSPREVAQQAIELLRPRARDKNIDLRLEFRGEIPDVIHTDGVRLRQILLNLVSNAIKFTAAGEVVTTVSCELDDAGSPATVRFEVADTGIGIADEHLIRIFEPFYQVDQGATRRYGGSGLGLAISKQLARQMGGSLEVESAPGRGSAFTLRLPVQASRGAREQRLLRPASSLDANILLAEDNPNIRLLVEEYLRRAGARVTAVPDGVQAVERVRQRPEGGGGGEGFDLVLLDLHMPTLDGLGALRQIRAAGFHGPIVGLTADYAQKSVAEWLREGWDAMAAKPIDRQAFIPLLARMLAQKKEDGPGVARTV